MKSISIASAALGLYMSVSAIPAQAATIAQWTFETSVPVNAGPHAAEVGTGSATGFHANAGTIYSNPVGNGSAESFSSDKWSVGDYYQFSLSTVGMADIMVSWEQVSSNTGPRDFTFAWSTDGSIFTNVLDYSVRANGSPAWTGGSPTGLDTFSVDLSAVAALEGQVAVFFRLIDRSTVSANGGAVATAGTDRVDNVLVTGTAVSAVPLPAAAWLFGSALAGLATVARRRVGA